MKKYMLLLAGLLCFVIPENVEAKAVKLGRSVSSATSTAGINLSNRHTDKDRADVVVCATGCETCRSTTQCLKCKPDYYLKNGVCEACPEFASCAGGTQTFSCDSVHYASGDHCEDICTGVTCKTEGWQPTSKAGQCCCELKWCADANQHKDESTNQCVSNCTGVTCKDTTYYQTVASSTGCCCQPKNCQTLNSSKTACTKCNSGKWLDSGVCKACPSHASCDGTATFTCSSGYYKSGTSCAACPSHATACSSGSTATACASGYFLNSGTCTACPSNATCSGGTNSFSCNSSFYKSGTTCVACPNHATCAGGSAGFTCQTNYYKSGNTCKSCSSYSGLVPPPACETFNYEISNPTAGMNNNSLANNEGTGTVIGNSCASTCGGYNTQSDCNSHISSGYHCEQQGSCWCPRAGSTGNNNFSGTTTNSGTANLQHAASLSIN